LWLFRFGFAEAANPEVVAKAVENMDAKEIEGRRLRVRGSKVQNRFDDVIKSIKKLFLHLICFENDDIYVLRI
jgi:hypothetical protein